MKYFLSFDQPTERLITVRIEAKGEVKAISFLLPRWRPGRYELQRYDRNVSDVCAYTKSGKVIRLQRDDSHSWTVFAEEGESFTFEYKYFANHLDAGSSYYDQKQIYLNGINLLMYQKESIGKPCELVLDIPDHYQLACGLEKKGNHLFAADFHKLVDAPLFAGSQLLHHEFEIDGTPTHFWFMGDCNPDLPKLEFDVKQYSLAQKSVFGEFPFSEFHYLFITRPDPYRHGVEHSNSTVIVIGPNLRLDHPALHKSFVEICSHELFHAWNVKALRPKDMFPYDYDREVYTELHHVTEGITTYYGDLMLWKGKGWTFEQWLESINGELKSHFRKGGKDFISLEQASFESWINGYHANGFPNRKISFYTKGYLVALLLDVEIRRATTNRNSLDQVMGEMYHRFAKNGEGYTREDYKKVIEEVSGRNFDDFFENYLSGTEDLKAKLHAAAEYMGLKLKQTGFHTRAATYFGLEVKIDNRKNETSIDNIYPESPAIVAGLSIGDQMVSVNGRKVQNNLEELINYFGFENELKVHFFRSDELHSCILKRSKDYLGIIPQFVLHESPSSEQLANRESWQSVKEFERLTTPQRVERG